MFTNLPDDSVYRIAELLAVEDLLRLSFVSRRLRNLCHSTPNLSINIHNPVTSRGLNYRFGFINSLNRFMDQRHYDRTKICTLKLSWSLIGGTISSEEFFFLKYLNQAVDCGVKEIGISVTHPPGKPFELPLFVLQCKSLTKLSVNANGCLVKFPSPFVGVSSVEYLSIKSVLLDNDFCNYLIPGFFRSLRELEIKYFLGMKTITISSNSLESFTVYDLRYNGLSRLAIVAQNLRRLKIAWHPSLNTVTSSLEINTPNLVDFDYMGEPVKYYRCLGGLARVNNVVFNLRLHILQALNQDLTSYNLQQWLQSVGSVKRLNLYYQSLEMFSQRLSFPILFNNLEALTLNVGHFNENLIPAVASLLKGAPNLKGLSILSVFFPVGAEVNKATVTLFDVQYWQSQKMVFHQLSILKVYYHKGQNLLEFVKYMAAHAERLREITIVYSNPFPLDSFIDVLRSKKASTTVYFIHKSRVGFKSVTCVDAFCKSPYPCAKTNYMRTEQLLA